MKGILTLVVNATYIIQEISELSLFVVYDIPLQGAFLSSSISYDSGRTFLYSKAWSKGTPLPLFDVSLTVKSSSRKAL